MSRRNIGYASQKFQSTLPRGSDLLQAKLMLLEDISIHAPSRERPEPFRAYNLIYNISIHAPSRERRAMHINLKYRIYFNPRSLAGATVYEVATALATLMISIHAPSRERR